MRHLADLRAMWQYARMVGKRIGTAWHRAARLACPRCGARTLFRGALAMHETCAAGHLILGIDHLFSPEEPTLRVLTGPRL